MHYLIGFLIAIVVVFYGVWILGILFLRLLGFIVGYSVLAAGFTFIVGLVWGIVLPVRVLRSLSSRQLRISSPQAVRDGEVFKSPPRGSSKDFGWDAAWPLYVPYQLRFDAAAIREEVADVVSKIRWKTSGWWPKSERLGPRQVLAISKFLVIGIPTYGLILGLLAATALWLVIVGIFQVLVVSAQWITTRILRLREARFMKANSAQVRCVRCYRLTNMPSYRCSNTHCTHVHHDVNPGPLGIRHRICECEEILPMTVAAASKVLTAECPYCAEELPKGAGSRRVVVAPIFGSIGSGKTQFLAATAVALHRQGEDRGPGFKFTALSNAAQRFLTTSLEEFASHNAPPKTQHSEQPEGYPFLVQPAAADFELHLMDAAGENFVRSDTSGSLGYLDVSSSLIFVHDPFTNNEVGEQLSLAGIASSVQVAQGQANDAYGSVIDRLRDSGEDLSRKHLAVVVTKADIIAKVMPGEKLPADSAGVREWLYSHGDDNLVRRIEIDFEKVEYFAVDSSPGAGPDPMHHPLRVLDWVLTNTGGTSMLESPVPIESNGSIDGPAGPNPNSSQDDLEKETTRS